MRFALRGGCAGVLVLLAGCITGRSQIESALHQLPDTRHATGAYCLACPDRLLFQVHDRPDWSAEALVGADGRVDLGPLGQHRVEGLTAAEAARQIADRTGLDCRQLSLEVLDYSSRRVF